MLVLMRKMSQMFPLALGLDEHFFDHKVTHPITSCKMIHYPLQEPSSKYKTGIGAHTDFVCKLSRMSANQVPSDQHLKGFTMLLQDNVGGLEVLNANAEGIPAKPIPGTFVINVGDFIMRLTNNKFLSAVHRVTSISGEEKYSILWFCSFNLDALVEV
jgi:isopenicillin N synthase-like dioxygenase